MKYLIALLILTCANVGWARDNYQIYGTTYSWDGETAPRIEESTVAVSWVPSDWQRSTGTRLVLNWISSDTWIVSKGFEGFHKGKTFTLAEFVSSGKFCAIYGHKWYEAIQFCIYCGHKRNRIKVNKEEYEWEP